MLEKSLTTRQNEVLGFIEAHIARKGFPPTLKEIGTHFGIRNPNGIRNHLLALERKGYIQKDADLSRAIRLTRKPGALSRAITGLKEHLRRGKGWVYSLEYHLAWCTRKMRKTLSGPVFEEVKQGVEQAVADHGWELTRLDIQPDHVVVSVCVSPDHSPQRVVRNFKNATAAIWLRHPLRVGGRGLWGQGFLATTDASERNTLLESYLEQERKKAHSSGGESLTASRDGIANSGSEQGSSQIQSNGF
ncbi:MAG: IS200/IS605 family transposase [Planctomycetes bacterium]|nr:IS200/IS605 family transposase [Planctomycetota bacterium]